MNSILPLSSLRFSRPNWLSSSTSTFIDSSSDLFYFTSSRDRSFRPVDTKEPRCSVCSRRLRFVSVSSSSWSRNWRSWESTDRCKKYVVASVVPRSNCWCGLGCYCTLYPGANSPAKKVALRENSKRLILLAVFCYSKVVQ